MASGAPPGPSAPIPPEASPQPVPLSWEGDRMFNIYIHDYCNKRGYFKTARELVNEAEIPPDSHPPINAKQGLLFEWWSVFWVLFQAKNSGQGPDDALLYTQHQNSQRMVAAAAQQRQAPGGPPQSRFPMNGIARQAGPPAPNGPMPNGIGPGGPPPLQQGTPSYGMGTPGSQPNGLPGPPGGQPQNFQQQGPPGQRPLGPPQQRGPNGAPPFQSPTMAPSPQAQGPPQPPSNNPMSQLGRSPHMGQVNRGGMPPPNGPQNMGGAMQQMGSAQQTPTQPFPPQSGRPPSRQDTPSMQHQMNPSPSFAPRNPQERQHMEAQLDAEIDKSPQLLRDATHEAGLGDKDRASFTAEDKHRVIMVMRRMRGGGPLPPNAVAGPSGSNMPPPQNQRNPQQPQQQPMHGQPQRGSKRNSTSPGEEHQTLPRNDSSPPDRKRPRRTPNPGEQQQPPMVPMGPGPFPPQQGPPGGPQPMSNGMMRGPGPMGGGQPMGGFPNQQGMPHMGGQPGMNMGMQGQGMQMMSPSMMNHPGPGMMTQQQMQQAQQQFQQHPRQAYSASMAQIHAPKNMASGPLGNMMPGGNAGSPSSHDPHMRGPPPGPPGQNNRLQQQKNMSMLPPNQPSMGVPTKPPQPGGKDGNGGDPGGQNGSQGGDQQQQQQQGPQGGGPGQGLGPPQMNPPPPGNGPTTPASVPPSNMPTPSPSAILNNASGMPTRPPTAPSQMPDLLGTDFFSSISNDFVDQFDMGSVNDLDFWINANNDETSLDPMS